MERKLILVILRPSEKTMGAKAQILQVLRRHGQHNFDSAPDEFLDRLWKVWKLLGVQNLCESVENLEGNKKRAFRPEWERNRHARQPLRQPVPPSRGFSLSAADHEIGGRVIL